MAKKLDQFTFCVSDEAAIFSIVTHSNRFVCPPTWRRMTRDLLVQMAYHTSARGNFICLSSRGNILAESFQFDWKENIFYKLEKYIQPDCTTTNLRQTSLVKPNYQYMYKCHDRDEKRSFTQLKPESTTRRIVEKI